MLKRLLLLVLVYQVTITITDIYVQVLTGDKWCVFAPHSRKDNFSLLCCNVISKNAKYNSTY